MWGHGDLLLRVCTFVFAGLFLIFVDHVRFLCLSFYISSSVKMDGRILLHGGDTGQDEWIMKVRFDG